LIKAGVARVVIACGDPDPRVAGKGIALLRDAGFDVTAGVLQEEAEADHAGFFARLCHEKPYVTLKLATSVDGRIATATGESQWITGGLARRAVHMLRARHDAVMVGAGTMRADDPMLTVRGIGVDRQPVRVVVSRHLNISRDSKLVQTAHDVPLWVCHGPRADFSAWETSGAQSMTCTLKGGQLDPRSVMSGLAAKGLTRVFCEGGGSLAASLLDAELVDELVIFQAGMTIGAEGTPGIAALGLERLSDAPRFVLKELRQIGADTMQVWQKTAP
jgi:diaminohydroxyphosphoribosylaminopyrimidine deaminase/5-amino-6-(5-phosphoribosylamino)uracil reductase